MRDLKSLIRDVPEFPKPGILFRDITPLLADGEAFRAVVLEMAGRFREGSPDRVLGIESRGFILAAPVACELGSGLVPVRKAGRLPAATISQSYELEYGRNTLEMHADAVGPGSRVVVVDDLLATGGTAAAAVELARRAGAEVIGCGFLVELEALRGRERLAGLPAFSLIRY